MKTKQGAACAMAVALLTGCGAGATPHPRHTQKPPPAYSDTQACWAFHQATTKGVPAGADAGEDTFTWLQSEEGGATPALQAAIGQFVTAWTTAHAGLAGINQATRAVKQLCRNG